MDAVARDARRRGRRRARQPGRPPARPAVLVPGSRSAEVDGWTANLNHPEIEVEDTAVAIVRFRERRIGHDRREQLAAAGPVRAGPRPRLQRRLGRRRDGHAARSFVAGVTSAEPGSQRHLDDARRGRPAGALGAPRTRRRWPASTSRAISTSSSCATSSARSAKAGRLRSTAATAGRRRADGRDRRGVALRATGSAARQRGRLGFRVGLPRADPPRLGS